MMDLRGKLSGGVTPAMATPLKVDGYQVDEQAVSALVDFLIGAGVAGLFVGGTTGEGILLPAGERLLLHETTRQAISGRVPVLAHVGANTTVEAVALAKHAQTIAMDGIVAVTPYFYPLADDDLLAYFQTVASAAPETPLFVYDIPHMAVNGISPSLFARLGETVPTLAGIKTSHWNAQPIAQLLSAAPAGSLVLAGNERIALGSLAMGAHGLISGLSTAIPEPFVELMRAFEAGDLAQARVWQGVIAELLALLPAGKRIGAIKAILNQRGIPTGAPVPPRPSFTDETLWPSLAAVLPNA